MAIPTYVGEGTAAHGLASASMSVAWPSFHAANDIGFLVIACPNKISASSVSGWTEIDTLVGTGTADAVGSTGIQVFWKRATSGTEAAATWTNAANFCVSYIIAWRGVFTTGTPYNATYTSTVSPASASVSYPSGIAAKNNSLIFGFVSNATDTATAQGGGNPQNANLANVSPLNSNNVTDGVGGGFYGFDGDKATAGTFTNTTDTIATSSKQALRVIVISDTALQSYVLTADTANVSIIGKDVQLRYTTTPISVPASHFHRWATSLGWYGSKSKITSLSWFDKHLDRVYTNSYSITAATANVPVTGTAVALKVSRTLTASSGTVSITGTAAVLTHEYPLVASTTNVPITGTAVTLKVSRAVTASTANVPITGTSAGLYEGRTLTASSGAVAITGTVAGLYEGRTIIASTANVPVTGTAVTLKASRTLVASTANVPINGTDADLTYTPSNKTIFATHGTVAITGTAVALTISHTLTASSANVPITGTAATLSASRKITASTANVPITGTSAGLYEGRTLIASTANVPVTGTTVALSTSRIITSSTANVPITGMDAEITVLHTLPLVAESGAVEITGYSARIRVLELNRQRTVELADNESSVTVTANASAITIEDSTRTIEVSSSVTSITVSDNVSTVEI